ncbi:5'-methylthioadenosine/adenosylhomocysteine nucleosidase [Fibrella forsythiae]|uniref:adenosylhomocysteine nucleosidase n=1 Tax=Fibrella forsythiae TaxID=2817061 RepID=A0ABS3JDD1_9BACT|nr:5'-methylthioadenosine/adenosylhomocysteine nucleosidase [Fibrella forsythiae]MBO0947458.1 5'-methylthioadenosine/adenosylhomocysteine nucleosidase [Fibrella forsythiae]
MQSTINSSSITALLGAFGEEVKLIEATLQDADIVDLNGHRFVTGTLGQQRVVVTLTGIGKVNAAMTTAFVIAHFRPQRIIFTGIAGGVRSDLQPGDLVIGGEVGFHDVRSVTLTMEPTRQSMHPVSYELNPLYFTADLSLLALAEQTANTLEFDSIPGTDRPPLVTVGRILTGDEFIHSAQRAADLRNEYGADAIEMEGAAVAQVCYQQAIPCIVIRSLSDRADSHAVIDLLAFLSTAARNSARLVTAMMGG